MIDVVLFDLDGVVRQFDPSIVAGIESRHSIAPGTIERVAFGSPLLDQVTTGQISRRDWIHQVGLAIDHLGAAAEWGSQPSYVDRAVLGVVDDLRAVGLRTAILTNGTDTIAAETAELGLDGHFDAIFTSGAIGYAKPDPRVFRHVLDRMGAVPGEVFFTDDSPRKLAGASALGMITHRFTCATCLRTALRDSGIPLTTATASRARRPPGS